MNVDSEEAAGASLVIKYDIANYVRDTAKYTPAMDIFIDSILDIEKLLEVEIPGEVGEKYMQLLYVNTISAMETYFSDSFMKLILASNDYRARLLSKTPLFKEKYTLNEILKSGFDAEKVIIDKLHDMSWHNIPVIENLYKDVLCIEFPNESKNLMKPIINRHDIVHRNGKAKDGAPVYIDKQSVQELKTLVGLIINNVNQQVIEKLKAVHMKTSNSAPIP